MSSVTKLKTNQASNESSMPLFTSRDFDNHEQVTFFADAKTGLKSIIAIHNTKRGPALGGCRMWNYATEEEAITDALRLSRGMTYKAAMADLPLGGGKSVIIGDSSRDKTPELFEKMGDCVNALGGRYIISEDVGITTDDVAHIAKRTTHAVGLAKKSGDPSPVTAYGVYKGIKAATLSRLGHENLRDLRFALQGVGHVGIEILKLLFDDGLITRNSNQVIITDINDSYIKTAVDNFGVTVVSPEKIYEQDVDVFVPCALGAIINDLTIPKIKASIIAGCANNQLAEARHGQALRERGILYAPDYVINAGGLINVYHEITAPVYDRNKALQHVLNIYHTLQEVFDTADKQGIPTSQAADRIAEQRFAR
jgi:leucine dehydrogenase